MRLSRREAIPRLDSLMVALNAIDLSMNIYIHTVHVLSG